MSSTRKSPEASSTRSSLLPTARRPGEVVQPDPRASLSAALHRRGGAARLAVFPLLVALLLPVPAGAHPMGNFSVSHYTALRLEARTVEIRYVIDMAEVPTFQEMGRAGWTGKP